MVSGIPATAEATKALIERISHIKHTHYGGFWEFTADLAKNDTAYTNLYLPPHTDGTYWSHAPGLQLLHCLHHDGTGGENILVDGFAAAKAFKSKYPESYELLSCIRIPAHSAGEENVCIVPDVAGELLQVTWNNDDRSTMDKWSDVHLIPKFYTAIKRWRALLREQEFTNALVPGRAVSKYFSIVL
jgi:trimethyllysine dioxygenase